jgi:glycosyltransferase involved in cell wall biosynthesis
MNEHLSRSSMSETITPRQMQTVSNPVIPHSGSLQPRLAVDAEDIPTPAPSKPAAEPADLRLNGVSLVIPAYNEELVIGSVVLKACRIVRKVIVVDDGSRDRTAEVARYAGADVIRLEKNQGKAYALLLGLKRARDLGCTAAVTLDGDGQHTTEDIARVVQPILDGKMDLVIGSRFLDKKNGVPAYRRAGQKTLDVFSKMGTGYACTDSQSGFRAFSKKALNNLDIVSHGYGIESDMIEHFVERGLVIGEVPIAVRYEVPHKHKMNPLAHGVSVLARLVTMISYRRPLIAFGIPGFVLVVGGLIAELWVFEEFHTNGTFHDVLGVGSAFVLVLGMLLLIAGLILNTLVSIMNQNK